MEMSMKLSAIPLPLSQNINVKDKSLVLVNLPINHTNAVSLGIVLSKKLVPDNILKIFFENNSLTDLAYESLLEGFRKCRGLKTVVFTRNNLDDEILFMILRLFITSRSFLFLRKFGIKDPSRAKISKKAPFNLTKQLLKMAPKLHSLNNLCLSGICLESHSLLNLADAITKMPGL
jgi:hypothetical protein